MGFTILPALRDVLILNPFSIGGDACAHILRGIEAEVPPRCSDVHGLARGALNCIGCFEGDVRAEDQVGDDGGNFGVARRVEIADIIRG